MIRDISVSRRELIGSAGALAGAAIMAEPAFAAPAGTGDIIDVHSHALLDPWKRAMAAAHGIKVDELAIAEIKLPAWTAEGHIAFMDRQGIGACVLSWPEGTSMLRGKAAAQLARQMNENFAELVAKHPKRFGAFATVPMDDMDLANEEMAYALDVLKLDGVAALAEFEGKHLGEPQYEPWFAEMNRRKVTLFMHPNTPKNFQDVYVGPNVSTLEFMFDTTRAVTKLVLSGFKEKYSGINIISTHAGGTIPFLAHRIAISTANFGAGPGRPPMTPPEVMKLLGSFYFDLTASTSPGQLDALKRLVPNTKLLLGFDHPMMPEPTTAPGIKAFEAYDGFTTADRDLIRSKNALELFPMLAKRRA